MKVLFSLFVSVSLALMSFATQAERITVEFTATIDSFNDPRDVLSRNMKIGDIITGTYTIDLGVPDGYPDIEEYGDYTIHPPIPTGLGFTLDLPNLTYTPSYDVADLRVMVNNGTSYDYYTVSSCCGEVGTLPDGMVVENFTLDFYDPYGAALSNVELNTDPAILNTFLDKRLMLHGIDTQTGYGFYIDANVVNVSYPGAVQCEAPAPTVGENNLSVTATVIEIYESIAGSTGINVGDPISGNFLINPAKADQDPAPEYAWYDYPPGDTSGNFDLTLGGNTYVGNPDQHHYNVFIHNAMPGNFADEFNVTSWNERLTLPSGAVIHDVDLRFINPYGNAISEASLPESVPLSLTSWPENEIYLVGFDANGNYFNIRAKFDSVTNNLERPVSPLTISPAASQFINRQIFQTAIYLDPDMAPIADYTVTVSSNGVDKPILCNLAGSTLDNRQIVFCSVYPHRALEPGNNTLTVTVELMDRTVYTNTVDWELLEIPDTL